MNRGIQNTVLLLLGIGVGVFAGSLWTGEDSSSARAQGEPQPLYWVAPMDPNYRRDQPGKSPMGMDLVPVYAEENTPDASKGTVSISPEVINNLGVRTALVNRGRLERNVDTVGYIQYDEDYLLHIHPRVEGWIETLWVKAEGDPVEAGEPLYAIYSPTLVNAQEELLLARKRNSPALIAAALDRLNALNVSPEEIARLERTDAVTQTIVMRSPQTGVLDELNIREGMYVKPGMEMMAIGQLEHLWVIGEIFERQVGDVSVGDSVRITLDHAPDRAWRGAVDYIYPKLDPDTRTARMRVRIDNPDSDLRPGMFTELTIATAPSAEALLIPREALIRTGEQSRVVVALGDGRFKSIAVNVGRVGREQVEIHSGLREGDRIVTSAQFLIDSESSKRSDFKRMGAELNHKRMDDSGTSTDHDPSNHEGMDHSDKPMDHENMNHDGMDHSNMSMDHEGMNHEGMDHSEMHMDHEGTNHSTSSEDQP